MENCNCGRPILYGDKCLECLHKKHIDDYEASLAQFQDKQKPKELLKEAMMAVLRDTGNEEAGHKLFDLIVQITQTTNTCATPEWDELHKGIDQAYSNICSWGSAK